MFQHEGVAPKGPAVQASTCAALAGSKPTAASAWAVPDAASVAAAHQVSRVLGLRVGPSTGTNVWGAFGLLAGMLAEGIGGSVVTLICDSGERYADTYYDAAWLSANDVDPGPYAGVLAEFERSGSWPASETVAR